MHGLIFDKVELQANDNTAESNRDRALGASESWPVACGEYQVPFRAPVVLVNTSNCCGEEHNNCCDSKVIFLKRVHPSLARSDNV